MNYEQKIIATGYDFFFENLTEKTLLEMGIILKAKATFCHKSGTGTLTHFFDKKMEFTEESIFIGLMQNNQCGEYLANMFGCRCTGSEFYIRGYMYSRK